MSTDAAASFWVDQNVFCDLADLIFRGYDFAARLNDSRCTRLERA